MQRTIDFIYEDLQDSYMSEDLTRAATLVIEKLPEDVQDFVLGQCLFVSFSPDDKHGQCVPTRPQVQWLIVLNADLSEDQQAFTIVHEIAHAWLKHRPEEGGRSTHERDADAQVTAWGWQIPPYRLEFHREEAEDQE
jgi:Zn-dependent peptidase ImmA (M78 family)